MIATYHLESNNVSIEVSNIITSRLVSIRAEVNVARLYHQSDLYIGYNKMGGLEVLE